MRQAGILIIAAIAGLASAIPDPLITPAPVLVARDDDPQLVGYIESDTADVRTCDYTAVFSSSGAYAQCCNTAGTNSAACNFFTTCSDNTLVGPSGSVACDYTSASTCNTAVVVTSSGASSGLQFLGCWQTDLGSQAFTIVRDTAAAAAAPSSGAAASSGSNSADLTEITGPNTPAETGSGSSGSATAAASASQSSSLAIAVRPVMGHLGALAVLTFLFS